MFSDKVFKLLESLPDQLEENIHKFNRDHERLEKEMNDFDNDLKNDIANMSRK